jgi:hypothetical protein
VYHHFIEVQSSEKQIKKGLDIWLAEKLEAGDDTPLPWTSAEEMYATIDAIQGGNAPFQTLSIKYAGPHPPNPPCWMTETYELCTRDSHLLLQNQLVNSDFRDQFDYKPYRQFNHKNDRVWSNLMSADWAWKEAVSAIKYLVLDLSNRCAGCYCSRSLHSWFNGSTDCCRKRQNDGFCGD